MNWRVTILILVALLGGFAVLFAIVIRPIAAPHHEIYYYFAKSIIES